MTKELADKVKKLVYNDITIPHYSYIEICRVLEAHIDYPVMQEGKEEHVFNDLDYCVHCGKVSHGEPDYTTCPRSKPSDDLDVHSMNLV